MESKFRYRPSLTDLLVLILIFLVLWINIERFLFNSIIVAFVEGISMEPLFKAGDLVILQKPNDLKIGDVIVYKKNDGALVIHRIIDIAYCQNGVFYIVQGDNNPVPDFVDEGRICRTSSGTAPRIYGVRVDRVVGKVVAVYDMPVKIAGFPLLSFR